jgi:heptosyltransferase-2
VYTAIFVNYLLLLKKYLKKLLIIRLSSMGDIVLTTPVIRCLKEQVPGVQIHFLVKKQFYPVIRANPYIDKIHILRQGIGDVLPELRKEKFDRIIDLHKNIRSLLIRLRLGIRAYSFPKLNLRKWLLVRVKINQLPDVHIVDRYFLAVKKLSVVNDQKGLDYFIPDEDKLSVDVLPEPHRKGFIAWIIGGNYTTKMFPSEKTIRICKQVDYPVVLIGGPEDAAKGEHIKAAVGNRIFNACGKFGINESAQLVEKAILVLTNDTGMMHIAAAFRKKIISFWGNTDPRFGMTPYMPMEPEKSILFQVPGLSCRPCSKLGFDNCPKGHFDCMEKISEEKVLKILNTG